MCLDKTGSYFETRQARPTEQDTDMAEQPRHPDISDDPGAGAGAGVPAAARPRWKVMLAVAVVVLALALMIALHVSGVVGANTNG